MADSVFKLVVDSKEYDSKIRRAAEGLIYLKKNAYDTCRTLEVLEDDTIDFVKALGQMDTVASSASGALAEMKKAFMELSVQYKQLTDAERQSPYGKALASSLDQLKGRIKNMERDMRDAQRDMTGFGDAFKQLGAKLGIPTDIFAKFGPAVGGAAIALKVATDAFKQNKEMLDDWKSGVEVAQSTYQGFLNALNTGDIRGFLSRLGEISAAAREAYKALDKLGTFNAFNQINLQRAQTKYDETIAIGVLARSRVDLHLLGTLPRAFPCFRQGRFEKYSCQDGQIAIGGSYFFCCDDGLGVLPRRYDGLCVRLYSEAVCVRRALRRVLL